MKKLTLKNLNWYKIFMASMMIATLAIAIWVGVSAVQKSMKMKIGFTINPTFEVKIDYNGSTIFCNTKNANAGGLKVAEGYTLNGDTLTFNQAFTGIGTTFTLTIYNYSEVDLQVSVSGDNASATPIQIPAYNGAATSKDLTITATGTTATLEFAEYVPQYTLLSGPQFNSVTAIKEMIEPGVFADSATTKIIFGKYSEYSEEILDSASIVAVDEGQTGTINAYRKNNIIYVLSDGLIFANTDSTSMFSGYSNLATIIFDNFHTDNVQYMSRMFEAGRTNGYESDLNNLDLSGWNTSSVTKMDFMFGGCDSVTTLDLSSFNTANVMDMNQMFVSCKSLTTLDLSSFNTSNVTNMDYMFSYCFRLTTLDLSSFNTSNVTDMMYMFDGCNSLTTIYVGDKWSTAALNEDDIFSSSGMFSNCTSLVGNYFNDNVRQTFQYNPTYRDKRYAYAHSSTQNGYLTHIKYKAQMDALAS